MVSLGVDPGLRNLGLCVLKDRTVLMTDTIDPGSTADFPALLNMISSHLRGLLRCWPIDVAAVESVVWLGRRKRMLFPLCQIAGFVTGVLVSAQIPTYLLTPNMKGPYKKKPSRWTEHEYDAFRLAGRAMYFESTRGGPVSAAVPASERAKRLTAEARRITVVPSVHTRGT